MNEENMEKVRKAMEMQKMVQSAGNLNEGVPIKYTSYEGNLYEGVVVFKKPTMADYMKMGAIKAEIFKEAGVTELSLVDESVKFMAHSMATLSVVAIKRPEWLLDLQAVKESDVIYHVYGKYEVWENSFRKPIQGTKVGDTASTEGAEPVDASEASVRGDSTDRPENSSDDGRAG